MTNPAFEDCFNLLCGKKIATGSSREVFSCRIRPDLVVKVEIEKHWRTYENWAEMSFFNQHKDTAKIAKWLAPCHYLSPDCRILLQRKCDPLPSDYPLPQKLPAFLNDLKPENFGILDGNLVCLDYALTIMQINTKLGKVKWHLEE